MPTCVCIHCAQRIEFPDEMLDQEAACPTCGRRTRMTAPALQSIRIPKLPPRGPVMREPGGNPVGVVARKLIDNIDTVLVGKRAQIQLTVAALFAEGHVLLEDVPGVAKTMLARALARSVSCSFKRVQCTPDLLPSEISGVSVFNPKTADFEFRPGPVFAQCVLADEINRATPRTQAALLEAMAERQVTVDGVVHDLGRPFFLIATQNPVDHEGTFPLPEAQLDRFLVRLSLGYPTHDEETQILERLQSEHPITTLASVVRAEDILECQQAVCALAVDSKVRDYVTRLVRATREHAAVALGASPRASLGLLRAAQALAALQGYEFVLPDDVKAMAPAVLTHRLILRPENRLRKATAATVVQEVLNQVEVPVIPETAGAGR